jgi:DNA-binding protein H-NS
MQKPALPDLNLMTVDALWLFHEEISKVLLDKITTEKQELERRLSQLNPGKLTAGKSPGRIGRRKYPIVLPKYRNPSSPSETWSGRGKQPRWLVAELKSGHKIGEFAISHASPTKGSGRQARS